MKDIYGRKLEVGDKVLRIEFDTKSFSEDVCTGFGRQFGKPYAEMEEGKRLQSEFIIIDKPLKGTVMWVPSENSLKDKQTDLKELRRLIDKYNVKMVKDSKPDGMRGVLYETEEISEVFECDGEILIM